MDGDGTTSCGGWVPAAEARSRRLKFLGTQTTGDIDRGSPVVVVAVVMGSTALGRVVLCLASWSMRSACRLCKCPGNVPRNDDIQYLGRYDWESILRISEWTSNLRSVEG